MWKRNQQTHKEMLRIILLLAWPTILESFLQTVVQYIDAAMVGQVGAHATAAVGMSTSVTWLVNSPIMAIGVGFMAYIAQAMGAGEEEKVKAASAQALMMAVVCGVFIGGITLGISPFLPAIMGIAPNIQKEASLYFAWICGPMVFRAILMVMGAVFRSVGLTRIPLYVNLVMNGINVILNYLLIFPTRTKVILGHSLSIWGAGYGAVGAGIGTAGAYIGGGILMLCVLLRNEQISPKGESYRPNSTILRPCIKVGGPVALGNIVNCLGHVVFASMVTRLGTIDFAAHTIALTAEEAFYIPGFGMQAAAATLAGNALGAKDQKKMKHLTNTFLRLIVVVMAVSGGLLFLFAPQVMHIFTRDGQVIQKGTIILKMVAVSEPIFGISIILQGIFSGVGDTLTPFFFSLFSMWGVRILGTFICLHFLGLGLNAVWGCMIANNLVMGSLLFIRYRSGKWNPMTRQERGAGC